MAALEKRPADARFEFAQLLRHAALRDVQTPRRRPQASSLRDRDEHAQLRQGHVHDSTPLVSDLKK